MPGLIIRGHGRLRMTEGPEKAKELEESLAYFKEGYENGLKSAQANARAIGARVVNYSESWSITRTTSTGARIGNSYLYMRTKA